MINGRFDVQISSHPPKPSDQKTAERVPSLHTSGLLRQEEITTGAGQLAGNLYLQTPAEMGTLQLWNS